MSRHTFIARCVPCAIVWACLELAPHESGVIDALVEIQFHCPRCGGRLEALHATPFTGQVAC